MITQAPIVIASKRVAIGSALKSYVSCFLGQRLPRRIHKMLALKCREELHETLNTLTQQELFNAVCVVDMTEEDCRWALSLDKTFMRPTELVLLYPEVYWIFIVSKRPELFSSTNPETYGLHFVELANLQKLIELLLRHANGLRTCFDPAGLRRIVGEFNFDKYEFPKEVTRDFDQKPCGNPISMLPRGIVIDEEMSYAFLNGYILYRHGYEVYVIQSREEAEAIKETDYSKYSCDIILEDLDLKFKTCKDCTDNKKCCDINDDTKEKIDARKTCNFTGFLSDCSKKNRVFISFMKIGDTESYIQKPHGGVFDYNITKYCNTFYYSKTAPSGKSESNESHSADFLYHSIAEAILDRARRYAKDAHSTVDAIHAAILAIEAKEILGGMTPFLSLEALKLQHHMEVTAECSFVGTGVNTNEVTRRFKAIEWEIDKICKVNHLRPTQKNSALVEIADDLRQVYRDYEQLDEEETALVKVREYRLKLKKDSAIDLINAHEGCAEIKKLLCDCRYFPSWYFNWLLKSFARRFIGASSFIIITFSGLYIPFMGRLVADPWSFMGSSLYLSVTIFFSAQMENLIPDRTMSQLGLCKIPYSLLMTLETILGYVHLGIFISYLYQKISRK